MHILIHLCSDQTSVTVMARKYCWDWVNRNDLTERRWSGKEDLKKNKGQQQGAWKLNSCTLNYCWELVSKGLLWHWWTLFSFSNAQSKLRALMSQFYLEDQWPVHFPRCWISSTFSFASHGEIVACHWPNIYLSEQSALICCNSLPKTMKCTLYACAS